MNAGLGGTLFTAYNINGYCSICRRKENAQIKLRMRNLILTYVVRAFFVRCLSFICDDSKYIYEDTQQMPQSRSTALQKYRKKEEIRTSQTPHLKSQRQKQ